MQAVRRRNSRRAWTVTSRLDSFGRLRSCTPVELRTARRSAVGFFLLFLLFLAADAHGGDGAGFEAFDGDFLFADFADAEGAAFDAGHGVFDLFEEELLAIAQAEHHALGVFRRGEVDLVREVVGVERSLFAQGLARLLQESSLLLFQYLLEPLEVLLVHPAAPTPLSCFRAACHLPPLASAGRPGQKRAGSLGRQYS